MKRPHNGWTMPGFKERLGAMLVDLEDMEPTWSIEYVRESLGNNIYIRGWRTGEDEETFHLRLLCLWWENQLHSLDVDVLSVREDFQRRGFGTAIMRCVEQLASELGFEVKINVAGAKKFWDKLGYAPQPIIQTGPLLSKPYWVRKDSSYFLAK